MPLPPGAKVGTLPDGSLTWLDTNGNPINADGTPISGQTATPLAAPGQTAPVQVPAGTNIDPNASAPRAGPSLQTPSQQAQNQAQSNAQNPPTAPTTGGNGTLFTPDELTRQQAASVQQANLNVVAAWDAVNKQQAVVDDILANPSKYAAQPEAMQSATSTLNQLYAKLTSAEQNVQSANNNYGAALDKAIIDPSQAELAKASAAKAQADAKQADAQTKLLTDDTPGGQRALNAAQAGLYAANQAKAYADAHQDAAQSSLLNAQTAQINALIGTPDKPGPLIQRANAEVALTGAQTTTTEAQGNLYNANADQARANAALVNAQVSAGIPQAEAANQQSQAALNQARIQQAQQGPLYGLQDQVNAIKAIQQQVFGSAPPGADLDALHKQANDLLQQFTSATIGGTTPYAASVAAANAGQNIYQTQAAMANQASQAAASRANAFLGTGGNVLATLAGMNANAPAGSTAMAGAFQEVMNNLAQQSGQGQFAAPAQPQAPQLPSFLQRFAAPSPGASATGGNTTAPVTINIGGAQTYPGNQQASGVTNPGAQTMSGQTTPVTAPLPVATPQPNFAMQSINDPSRGMAATGAQSPTAMPAYLQGQAAPTMDFLSNLWGKELSSGAVSM